MLTRKTILIADPSPGFRQRLKETIHEHETLVDVLEADGVGQADDILRGRQPDVCFLEIDLPLEEGGRLIASIRRAAPGSRIVVITAGDTEAHRTTAMEHGADEFLVKEDATGLRLIDLIHEVVRR